MKEIWKDVVGYEGFYKVSNTGKIKNVKTNKILKQSNSHNYRHVRLTKNKKRFIASVHRMVATAFNIKHKDDNEINHIDCNKSNNNHENLEWCTRLHNVRHANENGLVDYSKKLNVDNVLAIRGLLNKGEITESKIADMFNVAGSTISDIKYKRTWINV